METKKIYFTVSLDVECWMLRSSSFCNYINFSLYITKHELVDVSWKLEFNFDKILVLTLLFYMGLGLQHSLEPWWLLCSSQSQNIDNIADRQSKYWPQWTLIISRQDYKPVNTRSIGSVYRGNCVATPTLSQSLRTDRPLRWRLYFHPPPSLEMLQHSQGQ